MNSRSRPKHSILVIDDEQIVHDSVRRILEQEGYLVDGAFRVDQALEKLATQDFDLVLTDLMMPDRSGMEVVESVARHHPNTGLVMFTGFATVDSAVQSMKLGALDYLPKPFTPDELLSVLERALGKTLKLRRDREIEETYGEAEKALRSSLDLKEILNLICTSVVRLFSAKGSAVMLQTKSQSLEIAASCGLSEAYLTKGILDSSKSISEVFATGQPVFIEESGFDASLHYPEEARKEGIASITSVPLQLDGAILGFLRIYKADRGKLDNEEMDLLTKFAEQAARALENAISYEKVRGDIQAMKKYIPGPVARKMEQSEPKE